MFCSVKFAIFDMNGCGCSHPSVRLSVVVAVAAMTATFDVYSISSSCFLSTSTSTISSSDMVMCLWQSQYGSFTECRNHLFGLLKRYFNFFCFDFFMLLLLLLLLDMLLSFQYGDIRCEVCQLP